MSGGKVQHIMVASHRPHHTYLPSFDPYRAPPVTRLQYSCCLRAPALSHTEHEVCLRALSISPGQLNCAGQKCPPSPPSSPTSSSPWKIHNSQSWRPGRPVDTLGMREIKNSSNVNIFGGILCIYIIFTHRARLKMIVLRS